MKRPWLFWGIPLVVILASAGLASWAHGRLLKNFQADSSRLATELQGITGATTLEGYARKISGPEGPNAWPLYVRAAEEGEPEGALELMIEDGVTPDETHAPILATLEGQLDRMHLTLEEANARPWCYADLDYAAGMSLALPHLMKMRSAVAPLLLSASWQLEHGNEAKARLRVLDAMALTRRGLPEPVLISQIVKLAMSHMICEHLTSRLAAYGRESRQQFAKELEGLDLHMSIRQGYGGDVFGMFSTMQSVQGMPLREMRDSDAVMWMYSLTPAWREWDMVQALELMMRQLRDPATLATAHEPSSKAILTSMLVPHCANIRSQADTARNEINGLVKKLRE